jgi:hypothetical protein
MLLEGIDWRMSTRDLASGAGKLKKISANRKKILVATRIGIGRFHHARAARPRNTAARHHCTTRFVTATRGRACCRMQAARTGLQDQVLRNEQLKLRLAKLLRERFGASSEKLRAAIERLELILGDLEEQIAETAPPAPPKPSAPEPADTVRRKPARRPLPESLPRTTVEHAAPCPCPKCGGTLHRLGEAGQGSGGAAAGMPDQGRMSPKCWNTCRRCSASSAGLPTVRTPITDRWNTARAFKPSGFGIITRRTGWYRYILVRGFSRSQVSQSSRSTLPRCGRT